LTSLLEPGSHRAAELTSDAALVEQMLRVEVAWVRVLAATGAASTAQADLVADGARSWRPDLVALAIDAESTGNPVPALVSHLSRALKNDAAAAILHRGLTSQDVLDTALILTAADVLDRLEFHLSAISDRLAHLAREHRSSVMAGRTLTQYAVPVTFGLMTAQWLVGVMDSLRSVADLRKILPVQCGGAAGTLSLVADIVVDPILATELLAAELGLVAPDLPWHTRRGPITLVADAAVSMTDVLGSIATQVALLSRPEIDELAEMASGDRGGSSTIPEKHNPILSVLIRSASLQAPMLVAQLHLASAQAVDQRPDGAWHSEWPSFRRLLALALAAADQAHELVTGLEVHAERMAQRAQNEVETLLAERYGSRSKVANCEDPASYLGTATAFVDAALARHDSDSRG
jgi:3-carboxy-cis,cis-muconate cycloisomerase